MTLDRLWPDPDRRDAALGRVARRMVGVARENKAGNHPLTRERHTLTPIELRVLEALSYGLGLQGAADTLGLTYESVKSHAKIAARVLRAKNTTHAVATALRQGVIR